MSSQTDSQAALWLSVRPKYAALILRGDKKVELRRVKPRVHAGTVVVIYASSPVSAIIGAFVLDRLEEDTPECLWERNRDACGININQFREYFLGAPSAIGLHVGQTWALSPQIHLDEIRKRWPKFSPPQSFRYLQWKQERESVALGLPGHNCWGLLPLGDMVRLEPQEKGSSPTEKLG